MSATAPWSVKGIDPKAREVAKDLARRSGMTLGEWLNSVIMEEPDEEGSASRRSPRRRPDGDASEEMFAEIGERLEASERRSASAIQGIDLAVSSLMRRMDAERDLEAQKERRLEGMARELREGHQRLRNLEATRAESGEGAATDLKARLDKAQETTQLALQALERSFGALDKRLGAVESRPAFDNGQLAQLAGGLREQIESNRQELIGKLGEAADGSRLSRMEQTLEQLQSQTKAAEMRSARAVEAMGHEVMRIARTMNSRMEGLEQKDFGTSGQVLDQRLAELGRVLDEKLDREIARQAQEVDSRLTRQEDQHALALERLGSEITRISDRLSERIAQTERRSTQAIDDIGRRLAENTEKMERRSTDATGELAERLRQSEERTLRLIEEAKAVRARREQGAAQTQRLSGPVPAKEFDHVPDFIPESSAVSLFAAPTDDWLPRLPKTGDWRKASDQGDAAASETAGDSAPVAEAQASPGWADTVAAEMAVDPFPSRDDMRPFGSLDGEIDDTALLVDEDLLETSLDANDDLLAPSETVGEDVVEADADASLDDADVLQAGAAQAVADQGFLSDNTISVRNPFFASFNDEDELAGHIVDQISEQSEEDTSDEEGIFAQSDEAPSDEFEAPEPAQSAPMSTRDLIDSARAAIVPEEEDETPRKAFGLNKLRKKGGTSALQKKLDRKAARDGSTLGQALKVSALAMLVVGGGGYGTLKLIKDQHIDLNFGNAPANTDPSVPMAALALDVAPADAVPSRQLAETEGAATYSRAIALIDNGDVSGIEPLKRAAELGYVPAQMRLAALFTDGGLGIEPDDVEAREWVRRAAEAGEPRAMQHYATQLYDGIGGVRDEAGAVEWMRKSAQAGRVDSQYNLAHLYEKGVQGMKADKAEAFTWYMIAARRGDQQALEAVQRLTGDLSDQQRRAAQEAANNFNVAPLG